MRTRRGITVAEVVLIAVLAIIGVSILVFVGSRITSDAIHNTCGSNLRSLGQGLVLYAYDHDDALPPYSTIESVLASKHQYKGSLPTPFDEPRILKQRLKRYVSDESWYCPADAVSGKDVYYLNVRHQYTSYAVPDLGAAVPSRKLSRIPPTAKYGLVWDAVGDKSMGDPDAWHAGSQKWVSNHPDGMVNYVLLDLSLRRATAEKFRAVPKTGPSPRL